MKFMMTERAASFYAQQLEVVENAAVRLFVRGAEGFFLGVEIDQVQEDSYVFTKNGVTFFITENDQWHFRNKKLDFDPQTEQMYFI